MAAKRLWVLRGHKPPPASTFMLHAATKKLPAHGASTRTRRDEPAHLYVRLYALLLPAWRAQGPREGYNKSVHATR